MHGPGELGYPVSLDSTSPYILFNTIPHHPTLSFSDWRKDGDEGKGAKGKYIR